MSALNDLGYETSDELLEMHLFCPKCNLGPMEIIHTDKRDQFTCPRCKSEVISKAKVKEWVVRLAHAIKDHDIIVFQRPTHKHHVLLMQECRRLGKVVIQTADDNYIEVPESNPGYKYYMERQASIVDTFRACDAMDVTNERLASVYRPYCKDVEVLPNCYDTDLVEAVPALPPSQCFGRDGKPISFDLFKEKTAGKKIFLWGGSPTHDRDMEMMIPALRRASRSLDIAVVIVGYVHAALIPVIPHDRLFMFSLVSNSEYFPLYKAIGAYAGCAPVADMPFNTRGKSANKVVEYALLNMLPIASDIYPYRDSLPNLMACSNDERSWYSGFSKLFHMDEETANRWRRENYEYAREHHDSRKQIHRWVNFYKRLLEAKK